ncbi:MAG: hypothetical protein Q8M26_01820 [Pseudolabrys sp.]|nr:hypothetical protein [Pseudolabrys sp.]
MPLSQSAVRTLLIAAAAAALSACASPQADYVAADDEMLCRHSAGEPGSQPFRQCRDRLNRQHRRAMASNATQVDKLQPNAVALIRPAPNAAPTGIAVCREVNPQNCAPAAGDITGSVPVQPKTPQP